MSGEIGAEFHQVLADFFGGGWEFVHCDRKVEKCGQIGHFRIAIGGWHVNMTGRIVP